MGAVNTTYTFEATDTITSAKMNNIIDQTTVTSDAIIGTTLEVASGKLKVRSQGITSNELAANAITTTAITDGIVTPAKLSNSDFGDFSVVSGVATIDDNTITSTKIADATITSTKIADAAITAPKLNGAQTGTAPIFGVRAWAVFDLTRNAAGGSDTANTNRFIYASGNVSSVTKISTGEFDVNFTTNLPSVNYAYSGSGMDSDSSGDVIIGRGNGAVKTVSKIRLKSLNIGAAGINFPEVSLMFIA